MGEVDDFDLRAMEARASAWEEVAREALEHAGELRQQIAVELRAKEVREREVMRKELERLDKKARQHMPGAKPSEVQDD